MRRLDRLLAPVSMLLLAGGCISSDVAVEIHEDGTGIVRAVLAMDPERVANAENPFAEPRDYSEEEVAEFCDDAVVSAREGLLAFPGATAEPYDSHGPCGVHLEVPVASADDAIDLLTRPLATSESTTAFEEIAGRSLYLLEGISIAPTANGWRFDATFPGGELADTKECVVFRIRLPGGQVEHNADHIGGDGTLAWYLDEEGPARHLVAETRSDAPLLTDRPINARADRISERLGESCAAEQAGSTTNISAATWVAAGVMGLLGVLAWYFRVPKGRQTLATGS